MQAGELTGQRMHPVDPRKRTLNVVLLLRGAIGVGAQMRLMFALSIAPAALVLVRLRQAQAAVRPATVAAEQLALVQGQIHLIQEHLLVPDQREFGRQKVLLSFVSVLREREACRALGTRRAKVVKNRQNNETASQKQNDLQYFFGI